MAKVYVSRKEALGFVLPFQEGERSSRICCTLPGGGRSFRICCTLPEGRKKLLDLFYPSRRGEEGIWDRDVSSS